MHFTWSPLALQWRQRLLAKGPRDDRLCQTRERSNVARDGSKLGSHVVAQIDEHFIEVAPTPTLRRIIAFDDGVLGRVKMFMCVPIGRIVAATDVAAAAANSQMHPRTAALQALFAAFCARVHPLDGREVGTGLMRHDGGIVRDPKLNSLLASAISGRRAIRCCDGSGRKSLNRRCRVRRRLRSPRAT